MKFIKPFTFFLIINFSALAIGAWLMDGGPQTEWYSSLNQAPWTPPGYVFGVAWSTIMVCFSIYLAFLYQKDESSSFTLLFAIQFLLNISWNFIFFNQHRIALALISIVLLTIVVAVMMLKYRNELKLKSLLILPYFLWLCIATSLNAYILINN